MGRSLFPAGAPAGNQEETAGGLAGSQEEAQEVQLQEYQGWSQGTWSQGGRGAQGAQASGSRCRGVGGQGRAASRRPSTLRERTISARGQRGAQGHQQGRGGCPVQSESPHDPPMPRAARPVAGSGQVVLRLPGLGNCESSHILRNARSAPTDGASRHYAAVSTHDDCDGVRHATSVQRPYECGREDAVGQNGV